MDQVVETTAQLTRGRLHVRRWNLVRAQLQHLRDGEYIVTIRRFRATRSNKANRWYWGCIVQALSDHTGYSPEEVHEILKAKFLAKRLAVADGNGEIDGEYVIGGTTTKLDTLEFGEYCERVRQWAAELGIVIPDPV